METTQLAMAPVGSGLLRRMNWAPVLAGTFAGAIVLMVVTGLMRAGESARPVVAAGSLSVLWAMPFVILLGAIAVMPFVHKHWWEKYYPVVALGLAGIAAAGYCLIFGRPEKWLHGMAEYVSFIILLGALFVI